MSKSVFLSYRPTDAEIVERTKNDLARQGIDAWNYDNDVLPGQPWRTMMYDALVAAETVIVFLSPSFIENEVCRQQVYIAQSFKKRIIPIVVQPCFELLDSADEFSQLRGLNIITDSFNFDKGLADNYDTLFPLLIKAIRPNPAPTPLNARHHYVAFSKLDWEFVVKLNDDLLKVGIHAWSTATHLCGGDNWRRGIADAVLTAQNLILVLSLEAIQSYWVRREVMLARLNGIPIIPFVPPRVLDGSTFAKEYPKLRDAAFPVYEMNPINEINWIYSETDYEKALSDLVTALRGFLPEQPRKQGIFISYRRADSRDVTGRVHDHLAAEFGGDFVFQDVGSIHAGENFVDAVHEALNGAAVTLVMIGSTWTTIMDDAGNKRLYEPDDFVRIEVQAALEREDMVVIPVLIDATLMPTEDDLPESLHGLLYRQSVRLRPDPDFRKDVSKIVTEIRESQAR
jgi:TIR domain